MRLHACELSPNQFDVESRQQRKHWSDHVYIPTSSGLITGAEIAGWRNYVAKLTSTGTALEFSTFLSDQPTLFPARSAR
jgi:hypothetical protein